MKRIIVCCDGTWLTPDHKEKGSPYASPSNVVKMVRAIRPLDSSGRTEQPGGVPQVTYYQKGVGTGNFINRWLAGPTGLGLSENIKDAYRFIANNYRPDDEIFLFGFSRGAYTVRSLVGFIDHAGLLPKEQMFHMPDAYDLYQSLKKIGPEEEEEQDAFLKRAEKFRKAHGSPRPEIKFLGVWDTVGMLGIPDKRFPRLKRYSFHRPHASRLLKHRFQALAIHEQRNSFPPAFWEPEDEEPAEKLEQRWFAGVHTNIGGSYENDGLANIAFHWIKDKAILAGLEVDTEFLAHKHFEGRLEGLRKSKKGFYRPLGGGPRPIGLAKNGNECVDPTAYEFARSGVPGGRPNNLVEYCKSKKIPL